MIEIEDIVEHLLGLDGRTVGVEGDGFKVAVQRLLPVAFPAVFIALEIESLRRIPLLTVYFTLHDYNS